MAICSAAASATATSTATSTMMLHSTSSPPASSSSPSALSSSFFSPLSCKPATGALISPVSRLYAISASGSASAAAAGGGGGGSDASLTKRSLLISGSTLLLASAAPLAALADIEEDYKKETQEVISQVRITLTLEKSDPGRGDAVKALRDTSNQWVAKYRREKRFAGKPSYSNMYSVLNAVSGHYISYGDGAPLPAKRKTQILEEVDSAEKALSKGR